MQKALAVNFQSPRSWRIRPLALWRSIKAIFSINPFLYSLR